MERRKEKQIGNERKAGWVLKAILAAYLTSCLMLLLLSFLVYKFDISEQIVQVGIIATYILSAFVGGRSIGKQAKIRRFLWGAGIGILYLVFLMLVSFGVYRAAFTGNELFWAFLACAGGGMAGGMVS